MPKHVVRLLLLIAVFAVAALVVRAYVIDPSYYRYGNFRGDAPAEMAADVPIYKGPAYCQSCHADRFTQWSASVHKAVACETCHGAGALHPAAAGLKSPPKPDERIHAEIAYDERFAKLEKLAIPSDSVKLCTLCHEKMSGRPEFQKQVEPAAHAQGQQCIACHNPHSPRIGGEPAPQKTAGAAKKADAAAGRKKAAACEVCHGANGISPNPQWPSLAGQQAGYLAVALKAYKAGTRPNPVMAGAAKGLSDPDIEDLAAYFAGLSCKGAAAKPSSEKAAAGKPKAVACAACHGEGGISRNPAWPSLAGQHEAYLADALKAYRTNARPGTMMSGPAKPLSDADIGDIAAYYAASSCK